MPNVSVFSLLVKIPFSLLCNHTSRNYANIYTMDEAEPVVAAIDSTASIIEQLGNTFTELKSHEDASENKVQWEELLKYFQTFETSLKKKSDELQEKAKTFEEKETESQKLVQAREETVAAKEQSMLDRAQELKEAAVAAIEEAREKYKPATPDPDTKVSSSSLNGDPDTTIMPDQKEDSPLSEPGLDVEPRPELIQFCEQMDAKGLLHFITENQTQISSLRKEIPIALKSATDPAHLVLDSIKEFYPCTEPDAAALTGLRRSCLTLMESLVGPETDIIDETKQQAKAIADEWKLRLVELGSNSLEAEAFVQLIATFRIATEFDSEELCKVVLAITRRRQTPELCRALGLTNKMPGVIEILINTGRQIDAVHFIHAFHLTKSFPTVPLLKNFLKELRRNSQGKGTSSDAGGAQIDVNTRELNAVKAVIKCVQEYNLEAEYPLDPLQRRASQLEKAKPDKKRNGGETTKHHQQPKKARVNGGGGYYGHSRMHGGGGNRQPPSQPPVYGEVGRYPHQVAGPSKGLLHYYNQDERAPVGLYNGGAPLNYEAAAAAAPPLYGGGGVSNYGGYGGGGGGGGLQSSHPTYQSYI